MVQPPLDTAAGIACIIHELGTEHVSRRLEWVKVAVLRELSVDVVVMFCYSKFVGLKTSFASQSRQTAPLCVACSGWYVCGVH